MRLIMDAMEVLYRTSIDIFCLVTNDADYVPLCDKIHESKKHVIGVGYQLNASEAFIRACDKFIFVGRGEAPIHSFIHSSRDQSPNSSTETTHSSPINQST